MSPSNTDFYFSSGSDDDYSFEKDNVREVIKRARVAMDAVSYELVSHPEDNQIAIGDLVADLLVLAASLGIEPESVVNRGLLHALEEIQWIEFDIKQTPKT